MKVLILGGGGTLGAFSAGALEVIHASGWRADAFIGSSAGSINLLRFLAEGPEGPTRFWTSLHYKTLLRESLRHNPFKAGLLEPHAFHARVDDGVDYERMRADDRTIGFIVVNLATGRVRVRGNRTEDECADLRRVARASYALPPLLRPVRVKGELHADGGLLQNAPLETAIKMGATEIVYLCNVEVLPGGGWKSTSTFSATRRYLDIFFRRASNVGFADAEVVNRRYRGVPLLTIAPPSSLKLRSMAHWALPTPERMRMLVERGRESALLALSNATHATGDGSHRVVHAPDHGTLRVGDARS